MPPSRRRSCSAAWPRVKGIGHMRNSFRTGLLKRVHSSAERLQRSVDMHSYLFTLCRHEFAAAKPPSTVDNGDDKGDKNSFPLAAKLSTNLSFGSNSSNFFPPAPALQGESYHEIMKRQQRRLHSWPSREVDDDFEEDVGAEAIPRMRALESTAALSLATFASLLIEFVARLDHLVEAVDELAKLARFRQETAC